MEKKQRQQLEQKNKEGYEKATIQMRPIFKQQKTALDEVHAVVAMIYLKYAIDGFLKPSKAQKRAILAKISIELNKIYSELAKTENEVVTDILREQYEDIFKAYVEVLNVPKLSPNDVDKAINQPIDGILYSDHIWKNKEKLINRLNKGIDNIMQGKTTIDAAGKEIEKIFNVSAYESKRLLENEVARVQAQSSMDMAKILGVKVMWSATFENTCEDCKELDGHTFDINKVPAIPVHVNCHCILLPLVK